MVLSIYIRRGVYLTSGTSDGSLLSRTNEPQLFKINKTDPSVHSPAISHVLLFEEQQ